MSAEGFWASRRGLNAQPGARLLSPVCYQICSACVRRPQAALPEKLVLTMYSPCTCKCAGQLLSKADDGLLALDMLGKLL